MKRFFCVFVRYDVVRVSFHFQYLWRSMFFIVSLFIFNFYGAACVPSTEDAGAEAVSLGYILG